MTTGAIVGIAVLVFFVVRAGAMLFGGNIFYYLVLFAVVITGILVSYVKVADRLDKLTGRIDELEKRLAGSAGEAAPPEEKPAEAEAPEEEGKSTED